MQKEIVVHNLQEAVDDVVKSLAGRTVVRLDGHPMSGKSALGKILAKSADLHHIKVDNYLNRSLSGDYPNLVDRARLDEALIAARGRVILDCIWNRAVKPLNFLGPELHIWIHVQHVENIWARTYNDAAEDLSTHTYELMYTPRQRADVVIIRRNTDC